MNTIYLELGIQDPLTDKVESAVPLTHSEIAMNSRKTQNEMLTVFEEQVLKLYATLSTAWLTLGILNRKFANSKDKTFLEDLERIKHDLFHSKAGVGDILQKPTIYMLVDKHGNKFPKEEPFNAFIRREKDAYKILSSYDSFSRRHHEKFSQIEPDLDKHMALIRKLDGLELIPKLSVLRAQKKSKDIQDRATLLFYIVEYLYAGEERGARAYLAPLKGELNSLSPEQISAYLATLERKYLELGK